MERMMKVQEVILKAVTGKLKWWEAAEIIGISDRSMRRWRERYEEFGYDLRSAKRTAESEAGGLEDSRGSAAPVSGEVLRFQRATLPREVGGRARHRAQLHVGEDGAARRGAGG